jgi:hypothetical protein
MRINKIRGTLLEADAESAGSHWEDLYRFGGVAALITVLVALLDIILSFLPGERDVEPGKLSATEWFARFEDNRFLALRDLGLWNIINTILAVPLYLALYGPTGEQARRPPTSQRSCPSSVRQCTRRTTRPFRCSR